MDKLDRLTLIKKVNGSERDLLYSRFDRFRITRPTTTVQIYQNEIGRPDLLSYRVYGTPKLYWFLFYVNGMYDPFEDMKEDTVYIVPDILDYYDFIEEQKSFVE